MKIKTLKQKNNGKADWVSFEDGNNLQPKNANQEDSSDFHDNDPSLF